jgi:hypothetical protein
MTKSLKTPPASTAPTPAERRAQRQEAALKMNLKKRKDQARARDGAEADSEPKG